MRSLRSPISLLASLILLAVCTIAARANLSPISTGQSAPHFTDLDVAVFPAQLRVGDVFTVTTSMRWVAGTKLYTVASPGWIETSSGAAARVTLLSHFASKTGDVSTTSQTFRAESEGALDDLWLWVPWSHAWGSGNIDDYEDSYSFPLNLTVQSEPPEPTPLSIRIIPDSAAQTAGDGGFRVTARP